MKNSVFDQLKSEYSDKSISILGFGREGQSTYTLFRKLFPGKLFTIIDENEDVINNSILKGDRNLHFVTGLGCMQCINDFDVAIKSPGIPSNSLPVLLNHVKLTSQTDIFLEYYGHQVIGITGTKGKSTTSSLIFHILKNAGFSTLFVGNIGIPPFECLSEITADTTIVMELSSHQLEYISHSPAIAVILNIFQEHLDHYTSYQEYQLAKMNIARYQSSSDYFIYNQDNTVLSTLINEAPDISSTRLPLSIEKDDSPVIYIFNNCIEMVCNSTKHFLYNLEQGQPLQGNHNLYNIMAAAAACFLKGVSTEKITEGIRSFNGLEHRIERVGIYNGILWYNDSIATIPEATIEAVKTLQFVDTLILGGFDRGIGYTILYPFIKTSGISNLILVGEAGIRIMKEFTLFGIGELKLHTAKNYSEVVKIANRVTEKGKICLLSPAAASYDMFRNFEERGKVFKQNVRNLDPSHQVKL